MSFWRQNLTVRELQTLIANIKKTRSISDEGVSFRAGEIDSLETILVSEMNVKTKSYTVKTAAVRQALFSKQLKNDFDEKMLKSIIQKNIHIFQSKEIYPFKIFFVIANKPDFLRGTTKIEGVTLNFGPSRNTKFYKKAALIRLEQRTDPLYEEFFNQDIRRDIENSEPCIAHVFAYNATDAFEQASEALYQTLGLVNLANDAGKHWRRSCRTRGKLPVSDVLLAPQTTIHHSDGKLAFTGFWDEDWVGAPELHRRTTAQLQIWESRYNLFLNRLRKSPWQERCQFAAARYYQAFSNPNLKESFLNGWRLLENITGTRYEKYDLKIERASNVFEENVNFRIIGKHLAFLRNEISHGRGPTIHDYEPTVFQMVSFLIPFMESFILNGLNFSKAEELWAFFDIPASRETREVRYAELIRA